MKRAFKGKVFFFVLGVLVSVTSTVFAYSYLAQEIGFTPTDNEWEVDNVKDAIDDLHSKENKVEDIYPYQKFRAYKDRNGYVYTFIVYDVNNTIVYQTTYDCGLWGDFPSTTKNYSYMGKMYTVVANGVNNKENFRASIYHNGTLLTSFKAIAYGDNGSWECDTTFEMDEILLFNEGLYDKR